MKKNTGSKLRGHSKKAAAEIVETVKRPPGRYFKILGDQPVPVGRDIPGDDVLTLDQVAKETGWPREALAQLHQLFFGDEKPAPAQAQSKSTSRIPPVTRELESLNEISTFTSGNIGPWTERAIALLRTLESCSMACDALAGLPDHLGDEILCMQITLPIRQAVERAEHLVTRLARFEKPTDPSGWEIGAANMNGGEA